MDATHRWRKRSREDGEPFPFETLPPPPFRPRAGRWIVRAGALVAAAGILLPIAAGLLAAAAVQTPADADAAALVAAAVTLPAVAILFAGFLLINRGRRLQAPPAAELLRLDRRAPVLFLRSFDDDDLVDPTPRMVPLGDLLARRYEESLAAALRPIGPMIGIGHPGDKLELLGGGHVFVPDHAWRAAVEYLRDRAAAVVVMVGRTGGVWWEITSSLERVPFQRLLFFFPYVEQAKKRRSVWQRLVFFHPANVPLWSGPYRRMEREREERYALFRERVQPALAGRLPEALGSSLFVDFLDDGTPRALRTVRPWWWIVTIASPSVRRMVVDQARTLRPFADKLRRG